MISILDSITALPKWIAGLTALAILILTLIKIVLSYHQTIESWLIIRGLKTKSQGKPPKTPSPLIDGIEVRASFLGFSYREIILESKDLTVILNDGRSWIDTNRELLRDRLAIRGAITRVCLINPASPYLELLIQKNGKKKEEQLGDIRRSVNVLAEIAPPWADFEIRAHSRPTPYCLYLTESIAVVDPFLFFEAGSLPMILLPRETELYNVYRDDARKLLNESIPLKQESFSLKAVTN